MVLKYLNQIFIGALVRLDLAGAAIEVISVQKNLCLSTTFMSTNQPRCDSLSRCSDSNDKQL